MANALVVASFAESLITFRKELLLRLRQEGYQVHVAAPELVGTTQAQLQEMGCITHSIPLQRNGLNPFHDLATLLALWRLIRRIGCEMTLSYTIKPVIYASLAAWLCGVPKRIAMITGLGFAFTATPSGLRAWISGIARRLYKVALSKATLVFFQNPDDLALFSGTGLVSAEKCRLVNGSGVNLAHYQFEPVATDKDAVHFLMIARLLADKGVREYAAAASIVKRQYPNAEFHLVGWLDSNPTAVSQTELDQWCTDGLITFHGRLEDVRPVITDCDVYVLPSYREGTPRTVLEAMSVGRPVITTDAPGCRETVQQGVNGFLVPVADADALAEAMLKFVNQPHLVHAMGVASRKLVAAKYDVHAVNSTVIDAIRQL